MSQQTGRQNNSLEKTIAVTASLLYKTPAACHKPSNKAKANAITIPYLQQTHGGRRFDCSINNEAINGLLKYRDLTVEAINSVSGGRRRPLPCSLGLIRSDQAIQGDK